MSDPHTPARTDADRVAEIRERLDAASLGPWEWVGSDLEGPHGAEVLTLDVDCMAYCYGGTARLLASDADRALVSHAPDDLRYLLERVERLERVREELLDALLLAKDEIGILADMLDSVEWVGKDGKPLGTQVGHLNDDVIEVIDAAVNSATHPRTQDGGA